MMLTTTERAEEILPIRIPRMCQEANSTAAAADRTACQTRMIAQDGIQREVILTNQRTSMVVLMPIRAKREEFPESYDKNAKFSVRMLILLCMSSSYSLDANASSGRTGIFSCLHTRIRAVNYHNRLMRQTLPSSDPRGCANCAASAPAGP